MFFLTTLKECIILMTIGIVSSAPLDEQRMYFPGENPDGDLESRDSGLQPNLQSDRIQQEYDSLKYQQGYQPTEWGAAQQHVSMDGGISPEAPSYGKYDGSAVHQTSHSQGGTGYLGNGQLHQSTTSTGSINNGMTYNGKKAVKHTWTSHFSTSGASQVHHYPHQAMQDGEVNQAPAHHTHQVSSQDLASIFEGAPNQSHELHPSIKQAFDNVVRDYGDGETPHHTIQKISHTRKTTVQNIGKEPSHIQSTSGNDDINLSQLIEQLQILEQSPRHVNITWCEEKIKEFLRALRRKQASGVYINQHVQEETLHQVLTHEAVESTDLSNGIHEPIFTRVTVKPLGGEGEIQRQEESQQVNQIDVQAPEVHLHTSQEESVHNQQPEVITVVPHKVPDHPEVMSHQREQPKEVPPFTSDNADLKELELELPEYVPFEHQHSGIDTLESEDHSETRPQSSSGHTIDVHQTKHEVGSESHDHLHEAENTIGLTTSAEEERQEPLVAPSENIENTMKHVDGIEESHHTVHGRPEAPKVDDGDERQIVVTNTSHSHASSHGYVQSLHKQQINYDTLIEELIQLESIPGHQAIDKCEEKIQEFLEILKYQQEQGFGRNQQELERLHQTLIEQAQERSEQLAKADETTLPPTSFWRRVQKKIHDTYNTAKSKASEVMG